MVTTTIQRRHEAPSEREAKVARESLRALSRSIERDRPVKFRVADSEVDDVIELPALAVDLLADVLKLLAAGKGAVLIPAHAELTTAQAADLLNVSRPYLIKLLEEGMIPHHKVGRHRRVRMEDVMGYKEAIDRRREAVLDKLVAEAQELGLGYD